MSKLCIASCLVASLCLLLCLLSNPTEARGRRIYDNIEDEETYPVIRYGLSEVMTRDLIQDLYFCVTDIINRVISANLKFPSSCCKLPFIKIVCDHNNL